MHFDGERGRLKCEPVAASQITKIAHIPSSPFFLRRMRSTNETFSSHLVSGNLHGRNGHLRFGKLKFQHRNQSEFNYQRLIWVDFVLCVK